MRNVLALVGVICFISFGAQAQSFAADENVVKIKTSAICKMCKERIERDLSLLEKIQ